MTKKQAPIQDEQEIQSELEKLQQELVEMTNMAKRTMADFQNYKRHNEEQREELKIFANKKLLEAIFPALDNFQRAFESLPEDLKDHEWIRGIQNVEQSLFGTLTGLGLEVIDEIGIPVDPNQHEVLMQAEGPSGEVLQIFEKGYRFNGKTIRPAKVQVGE